VTSIQENGALVNGIVNLDKSAGLSSARVVAQVKRLLPPGTKIGHAGTLDPFATGVLVLLIGKATRLAEQFMSEPKQYEATVKLGATTPTLDPDSAETPTPGAGLISLEQVRAILPRFVGRIEQQPPVYSALKVAGRPAYALAREGKPPQLASRIVDIYGIELVGFDLPLLRLRVDCGRGTYIRALARDMGETLGVGGYLTALRRTRVGNCIAAEAVTVDRLCEEGVEKWLQSMP
jgi:tRNA pseudouridine55 synthase